MIPLALVPTTLILSSSSLSGRCLVAVVIKFVCAVYPSPALDGKMVGEIQGNSHEEKEEGRKHGNVEEQDTEHI